MTDGTPSPAPLAASPAAGTDAAAPDAGAVIAEATVSSDRGGKPFWARLDSPFTAWASSSPWAAWSRSLLGIALTNIATIIIYIALAMFAALGPRPGAEVVRKTQRQASLGDRHRRSLIFTVLAVGLLLAGGADARHADR